MPSGCALGNQVGDLSVSGFGLIEPGHQSIVAFLVPLRDNVRKLAKEIVSQIVREPK